MTLTKSEDALFANTRDLLDRIADGGSPELIKKTLRVNGLLRCLQKQAKSDPDVVHELWADLKDDLNKGEKVKAEQKKRKRELALEKGEENSKRVKRQQTLQDATDEDSTDEDATDGAATTTIAAIPGSQAAGISNAERRRDDRQSPALPDSEIEDIRSSVEQDDLHQSVAASQAEERESSEEHENSIEQAPVTIRYSSEPKTPAAPQLAITPPTSRGSSSDAEIGNDTAQTSTMTLASRATPLRAIVPCSISTLIDAQFSPPAVMARRLCHQPAQETIIRSPMESIPTSAPRNTTLEAADNQEIGSVASNQHPAKELERQIIRRVWPKFRPRMSSGKRDQDMEEILNMIERLNFYAIQYRLLTFAERRLKSPGVMAKVSQLVDASDPVAVYHAIEASSATESDAKLHRVYGQMLLVKSIQEMMRKGAKPSEAALIESTLRAEYPKYFLKDMAEGMTREEPKSIKDKTFNKLVREYRAGKRWMDVIKTFKGEGIVFVFIFANVSSHAITNTYTEFQRACVKFLFDQIPSMTRLVGCFRKNALDNFCRVGRIDDETMNRIRDCEGPTSMPTGNVEEMDVDSD